MFTRKVGPVWDTANEGAKGADGGTPPAGTQNADGDGAGAAPNGSGGEGAGNAFSVLDEGTREWLQKKGIADVSTLAKSAREGESLLGSAVRLPGKDATPEEREAFLNKLGRPEKDEGYVYAAPKDMPEGLPYDGEKAKSFKSLSHKLGLTQEQSAALHDFYVGEQVGAFKGSTEAGAAALQAKANTATETLVKEWGPLDGERATANFEIADQVFQKAPGGPEVLAELKELGLVGPNKEILSAPLAKLFASLGTALYTEDGVLHGKPDVIGNPFADGENFNQTEQMRLVKTDPDRARSLIAAAGKKPAFFGLK